MIGGTADITERKRAEQALSESEEKFRHVLDGARDMVYCLNLKTFTYDYVSPSCSEVLGYGPEEFAAVGLMGAGALVHPDDVQRVLENFGRLRTHPTVEYRFRHKELGYRWMSDARSVVFDDKGGAAVVGTLRDITERKRAEEALRESEKRFRLIARATSDVIWDWDLTTGHIWRSEGMQRLFGYAPSEEGPKITWWFERVHPEDKEKSNSGFYATISAGGDSWFNEYRFRRADGSYAHVEERSYIIRDGDGRPVRLIGGMTDITERKRAEEALQNLATFPSENANPIIRAASDGTVIFANQSSRPLLELWGCAAGAPLPPEPYQQVESALTVGKPVTGETVCGDRTFLVICAPIAGRDYVNIYGVDITERRRAEEALRESERRYRLLADNVTDVIWMMDRNLRTTYISPSVTRLRGYSVEEAMAQTLEEVLTPASLDVAMKVLGEEVAAESTGRSDLSRTRSLELEHVCKDGSTVWADVRMTALRDETGRIAAILGISRDITGRRRREEALRQSEQRFQQVAEASREWIWEGDARGRYTYSSPAVVDVLGYEPDEVVGEHFLHFVAAEEKERVAAKAREMVDKKEAFVRVTITKVHKDGHAVVVETTGRPILDSEGNVVGYRGADQDITERRRVHQALEESEKRYRLLAENATDIIWIRDLDLRGIYVNPAVTRIRGYTPEEAMAQKPEEILTPASLELARKVLAEELARDQVEPRDLFWWRILELENICKDGSTVWLEEKVTALRDEDRRIVGILGISRDISERKRIEEELQEAREELESRVERRMRRGTAYGLTFRELTVIHLVVAGKSDKEIAATLGISPLTASKHLGNILHKMGAASRTEAGVRAVRERLLDQREATPRCDAQESV